MTKHPLHIAFEGWKSTEEGAACHDRVTLPPTDVYLANRLYRAFMLALRLSMRSTDQPTNLESWPSGF